MFTKALILVLLGSSLVVSLPVADSGKSNSWGEWAKSKLGQAYESGKNTANKWYKYGTELGDKAIGKTQNATSAAKQAISDASAKVWDAAKTGGQVVNYEIDKGTKSIGSAYENVKTKLNQEVQNAKKYYAGEGKQKPQ